MIKVPNGTYVICVIIGILLSFSCSKSQENGFQSLNYLALNNLPTLELIIGSQTITVEVARSPKELQTGLMFRTNLPPDRGMLFVMPYPDRQAFWMKNTLIPLSIAYISPDGCILEIYDLKPLDETPVTSISTNVLYVLEVPWGWFKEHGITIGTMITSRLGELSSIDWGKLKR